MKRFYASFLSSLPGSSPPDLTGKGKKSNVKLILPSKVFLFAAFASLRDNTSPLNPYSHSLKFLYSGIRKTIINFVLPSNLFLFAILASLRELLNPHSRQWKRLCFMKWFYTFFLSLLCSSFSVSNAAAQDSLTLALANIASGRSHNQVMIGSKMPPSMINNIVNYWLKKMNTGDLKGKALVLDFWHQYCSVCLGQFPKLVELQKQFGDQLLILPVTFQSKSSVLSFFRQRKKMGKPVTLPSVVEDTLLHKFFPHDSDPHEVWIDDEGVVQAITGHLEITASNIKKLINHDPLNLPVKKNQVDFDPLKPLLAGNNGGPDTAFFFRSVIAGYIDSIPSENYQSSNEKHTTIFMQNSTIDVLYKEAWYNTDTSMTVLENDIRCKRIIFEKADSSRTIYMDEAYNRGYEAYNNFCSRHLYTYQLILPSSRTVPEAYRCMIKELDAFFNISSFVERRKITCLALVQAGNAGKFISSGNSPALYFSADEAIAIITNKPVKELIRTLNSYYDIPFVVDQTGYPGNIDITLNYSSRDLASINADLKEHGLALIPVEQELDMLVIKDGK